MKSFPPLGGFFDFMLFSDIFTFIIHIYNNMKNIVFIVFTLFAGLQVMAQDPSITEKAEPKEGMEKFREDFSNKLDTSSIPSGVVDIALKLIFVIEKDGSLTHMEASNNEYGIGDEAIRVLKTMPKWKPAKVGEKVVRSRYTFPVYINLSDDVESYSANLTDNELKEYMQLLQSKLIETPVFEVNCYQCELFSKDNSFMVYANDEYASYSVELFFMNEQANKNMEKAILSKSKGDPNITFYETTILDEKASGFKTVEIKGDNKIHRRLEYLYTNNYFIIIMVFTSDEKVNDAVVEHLKSTLKFKNKTSS